MKHPILFIIILLLFLSGQSIGQNGQVEIIKDPQIDSLIEKHINLNKQNQTMEGWRVQIYFESGNMSKIRVNEIKEEFQEKYPNTPVYISFNEPYYKVRVGDFRTRLDAEGFLRKIIDDYPNAFTIKDEINFPSLDKTEEIAEPDLSNDRLPD